MEIVENTLKIMDTSRITIVPSIRNNKTLIVHGYMYHFEDRGPNTCRWVCAKRKAENCRSQLVTTPVVGDETKHVVVRISADHTHNQCTKSEIDATLKRKPTEEEVEIKYNPKISQIKVYEHQQQESLTGDDDNYSIDDDAEYIDEEDVEEEDDYDFTKLIEKKNTSKRKEEKPNVNFKMLSKFEHDKVYILRTHHNRELVLVNGFLYRLEGKSKTSATFRWECIRSDINCKTRIYTERHSNTRHSMKHLAGTRIVHAHQPYTPNKLSQLIEKHKITVVQDGLMVKLKEEPNYAIELPHYATSRSSDPLISKKTNTMLTKTTFENKKITFLPSVKGTRLLCVGKMMYHYDAKSPCKRRTYWTCYYRHHKQYKCKARLITEDTGEGPIIRKMSGNHNHCDHTAEIKQRLNAMSKEKKDNVSTKYISKQNRKSSTSKAFDMSGYDSSTSCSSLSSDAPDLPTRLEDMRQNHSIKEEKHTGLASPERIDFVDAIECEYLENEHSYDVLNESIAEQQDVKPKIPAKRGRKRKLPLQEQSYDIVNESTSEQLVEKPKTPAKRGRKPKLLLQEQSYDDLNENDIDIKPTKNKRKSKMSLSNIPEMEYEMDISKVSQLRSAKGGILLCVDGYIYHMKSEATRKNYWICIKNRDYSVKCKSFVTTNRVSGDIKIVHVTNKHNHPVSENDIKRRLTNELTASGAMPKNISKANYFLNRTLEEVKADCAAILSMKHENNEVDEKRMKLYAVSDGPPSLAVRMTFEALRLPFELVNVDYVAAEHMSESYAKMNPQKEIPVLDDDGFFLSESIAIMQYLCDKYAPDSKLYPKDAKNRALVNHRLCFNMGFYYSSISMHSMAPIFFDYPRNEMTLKKVNNALAVFETYLKRSGTKYAALNHVTIADFGLVSATLCLEAIGFNLSPYPLVKTWYETFKMENPKLWEIGNGGMQEIAAFEKNPPDLSHMNHPFHPTRKVKA